MKRILITGGASGLGLALAKRYATAGWRVCLGDVNAVRGAEAVVELRAMGNEAHFLTCDVTKEADFESAAAWLETNWGGVDIVVNNAGVAAAGMFTDFSEADWQWILNINLMGVVRGCKVFTPVFRKLGQGRFVNIASMAGLLNPPLSVTYNVAKAGVISLSESLAAELGGDNIAISVVCPSYFKTNLVESLRTPNPLVAQEMTRLVTQSRYSAEDIAEKIFQGVERGDFLISTHEKATKAWQEKLKDPRFTLDNA